ncbi:MAG: methionyl-tRNA formyltransferase [Actinomycetes bacterium]
MNISVASSSMVSIPVIAAIRNSEHNLVSVISNPDRKSGRGLKLLPNDLAAWAVAEGLEVAKPADNSELNRHLLSAQPQLIVTVAYGRLIPVELLHGPRFGWLNIHYSLLPRWRGAAPVQWSIMSGDTETGVTIFKLDKGMDTGPIFLQERTVLGEAERTEEVLARLSESAAELLPEVLSMITSGIKPKPQPLVGSTLAPKISKEMGRIDWTRERADILRLDLAIGIQPGIWTEILGERIVLHNLRVEGAYTAGAIAGEISMAEDRLIIQSASGPIEIAEVTPAGKKRMSGGDFYRGARFAPGTRCG